MRIARMRIADNVAVTEPDGAFRMVCDALLMRDDQQSIALGVQLFEK